MFSYKIFKEDDEILLAIADISIVGRKFEEGGNEVTISEGFYSEKNCNEKSAIDLIKNATIVNAVGKNIIELMIKENLINENKILKIGGVPHAQIIVVK